MTEYVLLYRRPGTSEVLCAVVEAKTPEEVTTGRHLNSCYEALAVGEKGWPMHRVERVDEPRYAEAGPLSKVS